MNWIQRIGLSTGVLAALLVALVISPNFSTRAEAQSPTAGMVSIFVADPELGVLGKYTEATESIYFEARAEVAPASLSTLSVRLLDSKGHTIAVAGHSMDALWLRDSSFDAQDAKASHSIAGNMADQLARALADPAFSVERAALVAIATDFAKAPARLAMQRLEMGAAIPAAASQTVIADFYARAAAGLTIVRQTSNKMAAGNLGSIHFEVMERTFPPDETETEPRVEAYSRLSNGSGDTYASEFGGDTLPEGWSTDDEPSASLIEDREIKLGDSIEAVQALASSPAASVLSSTEKASLLRLAAGLRDGLIPRPLQAGPDDVVADPSQLAAPTGITAFASNIQIWKKPLAGPLAQHSGTTTLHYTLSGRWRLHHTHTYCNHGTCPRACSDVCMTEKCSFFGPMLPNWRHAPESIIPAGQQGAGQWHSCHTGYSKISLRGHNCHDDSWTQLQWLQGQGSGASPDHNRCNDVAFYRYAPTCTD